MQGASAAVAAAALPMPTIAQQSLSGTTLRVACFGGGHRDFVHEAVGSQVEKLGGKMEYVAGSPAEHLAKLIAARGRPAPFDVVEMVDALVRTSTAPAFCRRSILPKFPTRRTCHLHV